MFKSQSFVQIRRFLGLLLSLDTNHGGTSAQGGIALTGQWPSVTQESKRPNYSVLREANYNNNYMRRISPGMATQGLLPKASLERR